MIDFLSHAAIVGFMGGAAITIALQQLKGFLGIKTFTKKTDIVSVMRSVWTTVDDEVNMNFYHEDRLIDFELVIVHLVDFIIFFLTCL